jgi:prevent-host-death family protein
MMITAKKREIAAGKFKAKCLGLLDEVQTSGQEIVVTKYGKPVAKVVPVDEKDTERWKSLKGTVKINDDIVKPLGKEVWGDLQ